LLLPIGYVLLVDGSGPLEWWAMAQQYAPRHTTPPLFSWDVTVRVTVVFAIVNMFFWATCTHGSDQVVLQRYFSTESVAAARRGYGINVLSEITMVVLLATAGLALLAFYLKRPHLLPAGVADATQAADRLFPHFLGHQLPAGCAGLIISAFLCDAIQTLQAGVNSITAVVSTDLLSRLRLRGASPHEGLRWARLLAFAATMLVTANAYFVLYTATTHKLTIIDMLPKFFNMFVGPLAAMFMAGMFLPRCTTRCILPAVALGLSVSLVWSWWKELFGTDYQPTIFLAVVVPCVTTLLSAGLLSLFETQRAADRGRAWTWRAVVRGQPPARAEV
jgi:SSS family solute:Na+ symporter